jgi:hypothetical protein
LTKMEICVDTARGGSVEGNVPGCEMLPSRRRNATADSNLKFVIN